MEFAKFQKFEIFKNPTAIVGFFLVFLSLQVLTPQNLQTKTRKLIPPPPQLHHFSLGYQGPISDFLWLRAIQDLDYCEQNIAKNVCINNSWLFKVLDAATQLSPKYRIVYSSGALALSVIISDIAGASQLYDRAVVEMPQDWPILYRAGYHALIEEKNDVKAAERMHLAAQNGAPPWVYSLATRLYTRSGKWELAERMYEDLKEQNFSPELLARMKQQIDSKLKN